MRRHATWSAIGTAFMALPSRADYEPWASATSPLPRGRLDTYAERLIGTVRQECLDYMIVFGVARSTKTRRSIGQLSASALLHPAQSSAVFIINIAESDFRHAHLPIHAGHPI